MEKTWRILKEIIGKNTKHRTHLPRKITNNKKEMTDQKEIAAEFNTIKILAQNWFVKFLILQNRLKQVHGTMATHFLFILLKTVLGSYMNHCSICLICH